MIYIHIPFCRSFCTYCGFYSEAVPTCHRQIDQQAQERLFESYADSLCNEAAGRMDEIGSSRQIDTLYIGGGTPSVLPLRVLERIVHSCGKDHSYEEFTLEANPEDIVEKGPEYVRGLKALGVNRISMGVQSFDDGILRWMNRRHDSSNAVKAIDIIREGGMDNLSIDLIFGLPQLTESLWRETVAKAISLGPEHISAYQLSVEEGSALEKLIQRSRFSEASDDDCRAQYDILCEMMADAGYHHYEVSNFAKPGFEAKHNSAYWSRVPYVGLGAGAHSFTVRDGLETRSWNSASVPEYSRESETLSAEDRRVETIMLSLRTTKGIDAKWLRSVSGEVDRLISEGALAEKDGIIRIPEPRFFVSDEIIRELL